MKNSLFSWIGKEVIYKSLSGKQYLAKITGIPINPNHECTNKPTVSLEFKNERGKIVRKNRVLPTEASGLGVKEWFFEK